MSRHGDEIDHSPNLPSQPVSRRYIPPTDWKPIARDQRVSASIRPLERSSPASSLPDVRNDLSIYDTAAATWWSSETRWVRTLQNMVPGRLAYFDQLVDWSGKDVLDLGCAGGFMAEALAKRGARVTGIDPAKGAINAARAHAAENGLDIRYDVGVGENLPYGEASFDAVVCVDVLEHVTDLPKVVAEMSRILRPGGQLCFDTINRNLVARFVTITMAETVLGLLPRGTHDPAKFIKPNELQQLLEANGFEVGPLIGLGPRGLKQRGDFTFGRVPLTAVLYMGAAKRQPR